jgi:UDP-N-acetylmuramyl pentapeptide phosphotransferase/UDP-N-acetylglucosamine-1-phosphate transferase
MTHNEILKILFLLTIFFIFNKICINLKIFLNDTSISKHKGFVSSYNNKVLITGGFFIILGNIIYQKNFFLSLDNLFYVLIFCVGLFADVYKKFFPLFRIFFQILVVFLFIKVFNLMIKDVSIDFINSILSKEFVSVFFTIFCIIVLINGSNFIDGVNLSTLSYYLLILIIIFILSKNNYFVLDLNFVKIQIFLLSILFFFNFIDHVYLGDSGVYLVSFITSVTLIKFINNNIVISPYFAVLLLWYPCFENLFSIIRRLLSNKNTYHADNYHLHHLIYLFFSKKNILYASNITGLAIFSFNFIILTFGYKFYNQTKYLVFLIFFSIFTYCCFYLYLRRLLLNK